GLIRTWAEAEEKEASSGEAYEPRKAVGAELEAPSLGHSLSDAPDLLPPRPQAQQQAIGTGPELHIEPSSLDLGVPLPDGRPGADLGEEAEAWRQRFWSCVERDLGLPQALAVLWKLVRSSLPAGPKLDLALEFDRVLGLRLAETAQESAEVPESVLALARWRQELRRQGDFGAADALRRRIRRAGFEVGDGRQGFRLLPIRRPDSLLGTISSARQVASLLEQPDTRRFSLVMLAHNNLPEVRRSLESLFPFAHRLSLEVLIVDNGSTDETGQELMQLAALDTRIRLFRTDHPLGEGEATNIGLQQAQGTYVVLLRAGLEVAGDIFTPIGVALAHPKVGVVGKWGLRSHDLRSFEETTDVRVDAMQGYCFAFRRRHLRQVGLMDERFRFYRHLDIHFSFAFRDKGYRILALPELPLVRHELSLWTSVSPAEMEKWSKRNFYRFLARWGHRYDLLVAGRKG
ncbi:MAG TPA: glycosyltransferase, partial [Dehalococcoidia bacterium]|nr:glycosyltransferase [Dehalococcoidia bacterium]